MFVLNRRGFRWVALGMGLVAGSGLYYFEANSRTLPSFIAYVATGVLLGYLISKVFVLPSEMNDSDSVTKKKTPTKFANDEAEDKNRLLAARTIFLLIALLVIWQAARSFLLAGNWTEAPGLLAGSLWMIAVIGGLFIWWIFRRRAVKQIMPHPPGQESDRQPRDHVLVNLILSWTGALFIAVAGFAAELSEAGLLMTISLAISAVCLAASYPRSSWLR